MTAENLKFIRSKYSNCKLRFISKNVKKYIEIMNSELFSQEELVEILGWNIRDDLKIKLLEFCDDEISMIGKNYSTDICLYIITHNCSETDLPELFYSYEKMDPTIQTKIFDLAVKNIDIIIGKPELISEKLVHDLFETDRISHDEKINLLIAKIPSASHDNIKEIVSLIDLKEYSKLFEDHKRTKFKINDENKKLLAAFKMNNLIDDYEVNPNDKDYFKVTLFLKN